MALVEKLEKLADLRARNILTEEEFAAQKRILLSSFDLTPALGLTRKAIP